MKNKQRQKTILECHPYRVISDGKKKKARIFSPEKMDIEESDVRVAPETMDLNESDERNTRLHQDYDNSIRANLDGSRVKCHTHHRIGDGRKKKALVVSPEKVELEELDERVSLNLEELDERNTSMIQAYNNSSGAHIDEVFVLRHSIFSNRRGPLASRRADAIGINNVFRARVTAVTTEEIARLAKWEKDMSEAARALYDALYDGLERYVDLTLHPPIFSADPSKPAKPDKPKEASASKEGVFDLQHSDAASSDETKVDGTIDLISSDDQLNEEAGDYSDSDMVTSL